MDFPRALFLPSPASCFKKSSPAGTRLKILKIPRLESKTCCRHARWWTVMGVYEYIHIYIYTRIYIYIQAGRELSTPSLCLMKSEHFFPFKNQRDFSKSSNTKCAHLPTDSCKARCVQIMHDECWMMHAAGWWVNHYFHDHDRRA